MRPAATDVARSVVCVCVSAVGQTGSMGELTHVGSRNHVLDRVKIGRILSQQRCGLFPNYFEHLFCFSRVTQLLKVA